jgi:hypothetical protein
VQQLEGRISQWVEYDGCVERLLIWMDESEIALKNYSNVSTAPEKHSQLGRYQVCLLAIIILF